MNLFDLSQTGLLVNFFFCINQILNKLWNQHTCCRNLELVIQSNLTGFKSCQHSARWCNLVGLVPQLLCRKTMLCCPNLFCYYGNNQYEHTREANERNVPIKCFNWISSNIDILRHFCLFSQHNFPWNHPLHVCACSFISYCSHFKSYFLLVVQ